MRQFFLTVAGVFAGLTLFVCGLFAVLIVATAGVQSSMGERAAVAVPRETVLLLDLRSPLSDQAPANPFSGLRSPSLVSLVETLETAESDDRVKGVFVRASETGMDPAQAEEIHDALLSMRANGKFVVVHAQGFEDPSVTSYFAATAADEIWLQPTANFVATGLAVETPFFGGVFEKYGVDAEFEQFYEYKNAANSFTQTGYTDAHREATLALLSSIYDESVDRAAKARRDRGLTPEQMRALLLSSPYSAEDAASAGLVDQLGQVVDAREAALDRAGEDAELLDVFDYAHANPAPYRTGPVIAMVSAQGEVVTGESSPSFFGAASGVFGDTIADAILDAAEDDEVRAIVIRIDSPGGSAIASDQIWDAVERAQETGKPVIASFASVAASGGYYIAAGSDAIVANANTLTGSIGVYGGKIVLDDLFQSFDFNLEPLAVGGDFALAYSSSERFSPAQRAAFRGMLADVYEDFTGKVAEGRGLTQAEVEQIARGRVWTGAAALEVGLVDEIGGYRDAIALAKDLAGLAPEDDVTLRSFPAEPSPFQFLEALFGVSVEGAQVLSDLREIKAAADRLEVTRAVDAIDRLAGDSWLLAPELEVR